MCVWLCVQPLAVKGEDAARVIPSVMAGQGESYCWLLCWRWPSGLEVYCVYTYRLDWTMSLELICFSNSFIAMTIAYKEYYVSHNGFCDIAVLIKLGFWLQ